MNSIFGDYESQKMARIYAKDAFMRIKPNIVAPTVKENLVEVFRVVLSPS